MDKLENNTPRLNSAGLSGGFRCFRCICGAVFTVALFALLGCLDIPDEPNTESQLEYINVILQQEGKEDSTLLKIRPSESSIVRATVYPRQYKSRLSFQWSRHTKDSTHVLGEGTEYVIEANAGKSKIPNELKVTDEAGNFLTKNFEIFVNMEPSLSNNTIPAENDTIYGNKHSAILFKWYSFDNDSFDEDKLEHTLIIDGETYPVGRLTQIRQSGFGEGAHTFKIIVFDTFGDSDTLDPVTFYMVDTLGGKQ